MSRALIVRTFAGFSLVAMALLVGLVPTRAQALPTPAVIVVDSTQVLRASKAAKDIQGQIDKQMAAYSKQVSQQENQLQQMRDELERQRTVLAPDVFNNRMREYQQRYELLDRSVQGKRKALQQSYNEAMAKVENTALQIISDLAKERKANLVLTKAAVDALEDDLQRQHPAALDGGARPILVAIPLRRGRRRGAGQDGRGQQDGKDALHGLEARVRALNSR